MGTYTKARRLLRIFLAVLFISEAPVALYLLCFPYHFQRLLSLPTLGEPFFVREVGNFLVFATLMQYIAFRNPERNLLAVQLTILLRILAGALEFVEIVFILPPRGLLYFSLVFFCLTNFLLAYLIAWCLTKMRLRLLPV